jgi:hypothetical protein
MFKSTSVTNGSESKPYPIAICYSSAATMCARVRELGGVDLFCHEHLVLSMPPLFEELSDYWTRR